MYFFKVFCSFMRFCHLCLRYSFYIVFGFNGTSDILRGLGDSITPLYFLIISTFTNIGLDLLFILVFKWGIAGAACATVVSQGGAFIALAKYPDRRHEIIKFNPLKFKFNTDRMSGSRNTLLLNK
jgi:MATE family, multidrug efflux pump